MITITGKCVFVAFSVSLHPHYESNQSAELAGCTYRDNIGVNWAHLHHVGVIRLVSPHGGIVVDVKDGDVHLNKARRFKFDSSHMDTFFKSA